jgi:hypothetical protein
MKRIARAALITLAVLAVYCAPSSAWACKDRLYPDHFPVGELADYDNVYVVSTGDGTIMVQRECTLEVTGNAENIIRTYQVEGSDAGCTAFHRHWSR